jgi:TonB family protein
VVVLTILFTVGVHVAFLGIIVLTSLVKWAGPDLPRPMASRPAVQRPVMFRGLSAEQFDKNRGPAATIPQKDPLAKKPEKPEEKKKPEELPKGQIVATPKGNDQVDPNAKYLSESNNVAKQETRAKEQTAFYRNAMNQRTAPQQIEGNGTSEAEKAQVAGNNGVGEDDRPVKEAAQPKLALEVPDTQKRDEVAMKTTNPNGPGVKVDNRDEAQEVKGNSQRLNLVPGSVNQGEDVSAGRVGQPGAVNLLPSAAVVDKITGAAANDLLKDVPEGDGTYLSTREFKYASFFNRVKQSVGQEWNPVTQLRVRDPSGQIYGGRDRYTILTVTLDGSGRLKDAFVDRSSGLDFLDLEAIKAFERAQPFPNPPPGILATDQTVRFQFGFFLELSGRPGMRLFRSTQ